MAISTLTLNDGNKVPWVAFGSGTAFFQQDAQTAVQTAIDSGFTHLDCAQMYENEETVGAAIKASGTPRSALFITTKLNVLPTGQTAKTALKESLQKLGMQYVDLYLVHNPKHHKGQLKEVWKVMEECKKEGLAKSIGVSNFEAEHLHEILKGAEFPPSVNQVSGMRWAVNIVYDETPKRSKFTRMCGSPCSLCLRCTKNTISSPPPLAAFRPSFAHKEGQWILSLRKFGNDSNPLEDNPCQAARYLTGGCSSMAFWSSRKFRSLGMPCYGEANVGSISTSSKVERMKDYLDTANVPELTAEEMNSIESAGAQRHEKFFD